MTKVKAANWPKQFGHSCFDILSTFVIRISSFSRGMNVFTNYELRFTRQSQIALGEITRVVQSFKSAIVNRKYERFEIRHSPVAEESRIHRRGRAHAGARHRGEHGDLQRRQYGAAQSVARTGHRPARPDR